MVAAIADAPGRAADVGEGAAGQVVLGAVDGVGAQAHAGGVGAVGEVALVAHHRVVGAEPPQPWNDPAFELIGEQVRRDRGAAGRSRAGSPPS